MLRGLYGITQDLPTIKGYDLNKIENALKGGVKILQLRNKILDDNTIEPLAYELKNLCSKYNVLYIIDDRVELAKKINSDGVHIGKFDSKLKDVREYLKNKVIGVSCYGNIIYAKKWKNEGANYVAFGSFFPSPTKPESNIVPIDIISLAKQQITIPVCVIGGINLNNTPLMINEGADMVSVVSDLWEQNDIMLHAKKYSMLFEG